MSSSGRPSALEAFQDNLADAEVLLTYAKAFQNTRKQRMRQELRDRIGKAIKISAKDREHMDCLESENLFVVFRDARVLGKDRFGDLRPLLRPVIVAACAALETYIADKVMEFIGDALKAHTMPKHLRGIPLTVGQWSDIEQRYKRRGWGIRSVIEDHVRLLSSTAPSKIGETLGVIGFKHWASRVDKTRKVVKGTTADQLQILTDRRNIIAHAADRKGQGRASLEIEEVAEFLIQIRAIVQVLDLVLKAHSPLNE